MHHIFFIHSFISGNLGCFHILVVVNIAPVNIQVHLSFSLDLYPAVELLGHIVVLVLVFWGTSILFSIVAMPIYIPTNSAQAFVFFISLSTFVICGLFDDSHSDRCKEISHCDFNLHLPIIHDFEKLFEFHSLFFCWGIVQFWTVLLVSESISAVGADR